ncbi:Hsp70 family protein [Mycolicibacterium brumae]|uniref:Molecular chaperone n=1 Tax=Mycolicibacterium brumae TaxID=85968 RepID=A0A2G5PG34_9MYCO|nr:Hsp70 family protein [Mycolicibacterium brumae]MCV7194248.1 Hsp70 family protein [Mycolicibacterium brumae]PIB77100.1 molecular chaperone [Mycolicibacterium brumae]RWA19272.1 hypothetical protein MBRU_17085 [Mycolicibacterium brumae DSM 44177]UWW10435.1 Hsp70 family protein [Mycolicibacterium brumae]
MSGPTGGVARPVGLSIGTTNLVAARVGDPPVTRRSILTLFRNRPPEVGAPAENPALTESGLVLGGFVERVGDPVPLVAIDGSTHPAEALLAAALATMAAPGGQPVGPVTVAVPAHWGPGPRRALERALAGGRLAAGRQPPRLVSDATAALVALQANPGLPATGVVALLDFGGSGTSITLVDAGAGLAPIGETLRHPDFSGDQIDTGVLAAVLADLESQGADTSATAAVGPLTGLREECRRVKERLSAESATTLVVDSGIGGGVRREVRFTRAELEALIDEPLTGLLGALQQHLDRNRIPWARVSAVATIGGGAAIPVVTQQISQLSQAPVLTTPHPELSASVGAAVMAARGPSADAPTGPAPVAPDAATGLAPVAPDAATGLAPAVADASTASSPAAGDTQARQALAWSEDADAIGDPLPYQGGDYQSDYDAAENPYRPDGARPRVDFDDDGPIVAAPARRSRIPGLAVAGAGVVALFAFGAVVYNLANDAKPIEDTPAPTTTVEPPPVTSEEPPPPPPSEEPAPPPPPAPTTVWTPPTTAEPPPPEPTTTTPEPTTTTPEPTTTTPEPTTTPPTTTTTQPTTTTTVPTTTTTTRMTTTHLNIPGLPIPIPIQVPDHSGG